jgi:hydroxypyruvate isomerase
MKQSISWWCFQDRGVDDKSLLKAAKSIGYSAIELITEEKFDLVLDAGLTIATHGGHSGMGDGLNNPKNHDLIEREITANLELAAKYKIPNLIVFTGNRYEGLTDEQGADNTAAGLRRVSRAAEQAGVCLIVELLNSKVDHYGYQGDHTAWLADVVDAVKSPSVKILYDIYHAQVMEGDLVRTIGAYHQTIGHYHTAGCPGRNDLDDQQEINYPAVVRAISETGYDGFIGHEFLPKGDPITALRSAYDLVSGSL